MSDRKPYGNHDDPLERELADLRPIELPAGLRWAIGAELSSSPARRQSSTWRIVAAGLAMAACVAVSAIVVHGRRTSVATNPGPATSVALVETEVAPLPAPTLGELRLALARSPEAAEALLTGAARASNAPTMSPRAFGPVASNAGSAEPKF